MKNEERYKGFRDSKNMTNFEAFRYYVISTSLNLFFSVEWQALWISKFFPIRSATQKFVKKLYLIFRDFFNDNWWANKKNSREVLNFQLLHYRQIGNILQMIFSFTHFCIKLCRILKITNPDQTAIFFLHMDQSRWNTILKNLV